MAIFPSFYTELIDILIYLAVILHFLTAENNEKRIYFLLVVAGFFAIVLFLPNDFFLAQALIVAWLILTDTPMIASKNVMLGLLAVMILLPLTSPFFYVVAFVFYVILVFGFVISGINKFKSKFLAKA